MHQVLRLGGRIGAGVDEDEVLGLVWDNGCEGRSLDPVEGAQAQSASGHQASGVSATYDDFGFARFDQLDRPDHA